MTIRNREEAARAAEATKTNSVGMCQAVTRGYFNAPSAGDFDGDGAADAEDGWKKEPSWARHSDRNPPRGTPVSFVGGSRDNGHRAISLGNGVIRSTDFDGVTKRFRAGVVGNGTIDQIAQAMGVTYVGWSETINGHKIPLPGKTKVEPMRIDGVDISHHQNGKIDWAALKKAGVKWVYHKSTEGNGFRDRNYAARRKEAKAAGMPFGAYHFARPEAGDARREAAFFVATAKPVPGDLRPALDLETKEYLSGAALVKWADEFCDEVEELCGVTPVVYTPYVLSSALEKKAIFWVPRYNNSNTPPTRQWDIWQFSNGVFGVPNKVPGLGHVDLNHSKVQLSELRIPKSLSGSKGVNVDEAIKRLKAAEKRAKDGSHRDTLIKRALARLAKIKPVK